ncbi:MAG: hypothetical protein JWO68_216 [Actinomycetia bacterium]|nr:hypothetical protein [Actinomycetes bacterium]
MDRRPLVAVAAMGVLLLLAPTAGAQTADDQLTGYIGTASGAVFSVQPIFPGLLPTGDAPFEVTGGLSTANVKSGGNAFGQAEAVWPGSAAANMGPLLGQAAGNPVFYQLPAYPLGVQASQSDEPMSQGVAPGPVVKASGRDGRSQSLVQAGGGGIPGIFTFGSVSSSSRAAVEDGTLVTESTVVLHDVVLGTGQVTIDAVRSVSRATSTGGSSDSKGTTDVAGLKVQGQGATIDHEGLHGAGPLTAGLAGALKAAGIDLVLVDGDGHSSGGAADRVSSGLLATIANPAAATNPQFTGSRFVVALAPTAVGALASPPFDASSFTDVALPAPLASGSGFSAIAGAVGDVYGGGGPAGTSGAPAASPVGFENARKVLPPVGGVPGSLVLALLVGLVFGSRWISRYVGRFVSIEE